MLLMLRLSVEAAADAFVLLMLLMLLMLLVLLMMPMLLVLYAGTLLPATVALFCFTS